MIEGVRDGVRRPEILPPPGVEPEVEHTADLRNHATPGSASSCTSRQVLRATEAGMFRRVRTSSLRRPSPGGNYSMVLSRSTVVAVAQGAAGRMWQSPCAAVYSIRAGLQPGPRPGGARRLRGRRPDGHADE